MEENRIDDAGFDAYQLILTFFDGEAGKFLLHADEELSVDYENAYREMINRRVSGEPLQYIIGKWDFYNSSFFVGEGVLIPRPETEELVEKCIELIKKNNYCVIYDLCTGSGCIGLSIAKECPGVTCYLFELYDNAFSYASENLRTLNLSDVKLIKHDVLVKYNEDLPMADLIVSNPPYIESADINDLQSEVLREPITALDGGEDGLLFYKAFLENWSIRLKDKGYFAFECGETQTEYIINLAGDSYQSCSYKDMYGNDRFVFLQKS